MNRELVINVSRDEMGIALLEDKKLVELNKEKKNIQFSVGDIYLGRVKKIMTGLNAAFVDIGYEKDAFLHYHDLGPQFQSYNKYLESIFKKAKTLPFQKFKGVPDINKNGKINNVLKSGQKVLVQIAKEPIANKGPRLSSEISIAGRNLIVIPFSDRVSVSQKIESPEEKNRLKQLLKSIRPKNYGIIVRTAAEGKKVAELDSELRQLVKKWETALIDIANLHPPQIVMSELSRSTAMIRDILNVSFNNIFIDDETVHEEVREYINEVAPEKKKIVKQYSGRTPIFEHFGINKQIKSSFGRIIPFKQGAYLIIEHTEALHVIDVNSGKRSEKNDQESNALEVNMAAAEEISRQLRLRDMGGIIVVDFIDMHTHENKQKLYDHMRQVMSEDRTKHSILPLSKFGLMQITRQRVRPEMNIKTVEKCPTCHGKGEISPSILFIDELENNLKKTIEDNEVKKIILKLHPFIASHVTKGFFNSLKKQWQKRFHCKIRIQHISSFSLMQYKIEDETGTELNLE